MKIRKFWFVSWLIIAAIIGSILNSIAIDYVKTKELREMGFDVD